MTAFGYVGGDPSKLSKTGYTKGDIVAADTTGTLLRVPIGTPGNVLTVNAAQPELLDYEPGGGGGGGAVSSVFGRTGAVVAANGDYTAAQVGADASGAAAAVLATSVQKAQNLSDLANVVTARTNLGLGTAATQNVGAFDAAGAAAAAQAASQPLDSDLTAIAGQTATTGNMLLSVASAWASSTPATVKTALALNNLDNTSDVNKPVSTAQQTALNLKANLAGPTFTGTVGGITSAMVGLGNVDNTSDVNKPVSTAQQTALNLKANIASPTFTGTATFARQINTPVVLTDAATIAVNASLGNTFRLTLTGSGHTLGNPSSPTDGQMLLFEIIQSAGGSNTLTLDTKFAFGTGITSFTMTATASKRDFLGVFYNLAADKFFVIALAQGY